MEVGLKSNSIKFHLVVRGLFRHQKPLPDQKIGLVHLNVSEGFAARVSNLAKFFLKPPCRSHGKCFNNLEISANKDNCEITSCLTHMGSTVIHYFMKDHCSKLSILG